MTVSPWTRDTLLKSRRPLRCGRCGEVIPEGASVLVDEGEPMRYACTEVCANAMSLADVSAVAASVPAPPKERPRYGDGAQSDEDDPAF